METIEVIHQDADFIFINKPAGMLVHDVPGHRTKEITVVDEVLRRFPEISSVGDDTIQRPGIVHRLDKDTSGIMVIARNQRSFEYLKKLFSAGGGSSSGGQINRIKKTYLALVYGKAPRQGVIEKPLALKSGTTKRTVHAGKMAKEAVTEYRTKKYFSAPPAGGRRSTPPVDEIFSLLEVYPKTGRTHQIRVHLASIGHPVVGDTLYGKKKTILLVPRQFLHAESLEFSNQNGKRVRIEAELPKDLREVLDSLEEL